MKASIACSNSEETKFNKQYEKYQRALKLQGMSKSTTERPKFKCPKCGTDMLIIHQTFKCYRFPVWTKKEYRKIPA